MLETAEPGTTCGNGLRDTVTNWEVDKAQVRVTSLVLSANVTYTLKKVAAFEL